MKIVKGLVLGLILTFTCSSAYSGTMKEASINMVGREQKGFDEPVYHTSKDKSIGNFLYITALAPHANFPYSSSEQGSVFYKLFTDIAEEGDTWLTLVYAPKNYEEKRLEFERGKNEDVNALFGVYYKNLPLFHNKFLYPAIATNNVHLIMPTYKKINLSSKNELKEYHGIHVVTDEVSDIVFEDFKKLNIREVKDFSTAFEELLSGKADYMVASYYASKIEVYKLGIKKYVTFSKAPLWKMPMFLRVSPQLMRNPKIEHLKAYLKSSAYKKKRDELFDEVLEIYKRNTEGIVPPTYIKATSEDPSAPETPEDEDNKKEDNQSE